MNILFLAPHLSTGGMPAFLLKRVQELHKLVRIYVVEFSNFSDYYVVQKNQIKALLPENQFFTLGEDKMELIDIIKNNNIDVVHVEEMVEGFESFNRMPLNLINALYANDRTWRMVETCHNVWFNPDQLKKMQPDAYAFVTPFHEDTFKNMPTIKKVIQYPLENKQPGIISKIAAKTRLRFDALKTNVVSVGLWTKGKNQAELIEKARLYKDIHFHIIGNQAPNFKDYWEPLVENLPSNVTVWGEQSNVEDFLKAADIFMFNSTWECNPLVIREAINHALPIVARNLPQYKGMFDDYILPIDTDLRDIKDKYFDGIVHYKFPENTFAQDHIDLYEYLVKIPVLTQNPIKSRATITQHFVDNPFLEITGEGDADYRVEFSDEQGVVHYSDTIKVNSWVKLNRRYYTKWTTKVWENGTLIHHSTLDLTGKRVFISVESKSLGDTIAWVPYAYEFQKKHNCKVILSSFFNKILDYPELELVEPGTVVDNIYAQYRIGWFFDKDREPHVPLLVPMQKAVSAILGLDHVEMKPKLVTRKIKVDGTKQVCIGIHSTAQAKYWNNPTGWQEVVDWLIAQGYTVKLLSKEGVEYMGNKAPKGVVLHPAGDIESVIDELNRSEAFIGIGSGLSWLSWALNRPTFIISGFSYDWAEMTDCVRISAPEGKCSGCFNRVRLNASDWNWCPDNRDFECTKSITGQMVIDKLAIHNVFSSK